MTKNIARSFFPLALLPFYNYRWTNVFKVSVMPVLNTIFNNISVIWWRTVLLVQETTWVSGRKPL